MMNLPFSDILPCGACRFSDVGELLECRAKQRIPQNAKSVIVYLFPYFLGDEYYEESNISKYAVPCDYHVVVSEYLRKICGILKTQYPENNFEPFCDNSPIREVEAGCFCGLGVKGRNGLLINEKYGSFCFIGEIVTDLECEYSLPEDRTCLSCGVCEKECPGKALGRYKVVEERCLSAITQKKGERSPCEQKLIKESGVIWGCDICQNVCPMNKGVLVTPIKEFFETAKIVYEPCDNIENRAFSWRGKKVIDRNFEIICCKE